MWRSCLVLFGSVGGGAFLLKLGGGAFCPHLLLFFSRSCVFFVFFLRPSVVVFSVIYVFLFC